MLNSSEACQSESSSAIERSVLSHCCELTRFSIALTESGLRAVVHIVADAENKRSVAADDASWPRKSLAMS